MREVIAWLNGLPESAVYAVLWIGAALENIVPAVPADTFVALGGFLAGTGGLSALWVFLGTWAFNVTGALAVYRASHLYGRDFFQGGLGELAVKPHQLERVEAFYDRWGTPAIFLSRFLPGIRAVVPVFAGVTHQPWHRVAPPVIVASALWYGGLVYVGTLVGRNLDLLDRILDRLNSTLGIAALVLGAAVVIWWIRTRREPDE